MTQDCVAGEGREPAPPPNRPSQLPDPSLIIDLAVAYRGSMVLFAATDLGLFTALADGAQTIEQVAAACDTHPRPTEALLNACVAYGLLTRGDDRYLNTPIADALLVRDRPAYIGQGLKYSEDLYPDWGRLAELVRTNRPVVEAEEMLGGDPERTRHFVLAMHNRARATSVVLPRELDLHGRRQLLDVGGGPGTYSIALVRQTPGLNAVILDLPGVLAITREIVAGEGCADRITLLPGDYLKTPFNEGNDAVLLSGMMHRETPANCRMLLRKAFGSLIPGGLVIVSDVFFENERKDQPVFAAHFALNMMLTSPDGSAHAKTEMVAWMREAGFDGIDVRAPRPPKPETIIVGTKPPRTP